MSSKRYGKILRTHYNTGTEVLINLEHVVLAYPHENYTVVKLADGGQLTCVTPFDEFATILVDGIRS